MPPPFNIFFGNQDIEATLQRIERKVDQLLAGQQAGKELIMAEQDEINNLVTQVQKNTDVVASASAALQGYVTTVADLTQQLQAAIAAGGSDVSPAIKSAADAIAANNDALSAAIPKVAAAVSANIS